MATIPTMQAAPRAATVTPGADAVEPDAGGPFHAFLTCAGPERIAAPVAEAVVGRPALLSGEVGTDRDAGCHDATGPSDVQSALAMLPLVAQLPAPATVPVLPGAGDTTTGIASEASGTATTGPVAPGALQPGTVRPWESPSGPASLRAGAHPASGVPPRPLDGEPATSIGPNMIENGREAGENAPVGLVPDGAAATDAAGSSGSPTTAIALTAGGSERPAHAPAMPAAVRNLHVPVGDPHWPDALGREVRLLIARGVHSAKLRLSPEDLGPVDVHIDLSDDRASVWFAAAQADTRAALADALPRLRELLSSAGFNLSDAGVHREAPRESGARPDPQAESGQVEADPSQRLTARTLAIVDRPGLLDEYA